MIRVIDQNGNELAPTYRRRARGLVKHGRAVYTGSTEDEIRLTEQVSSVKIAEDIMNNDIIIKDNIITEAEATEVTALTSTTELTEEDYRAVHDGECSPFSFEYILDRLEAIRVDNGHIGQAFQALKRFQVNESPQGGISDAERAKSIMTLVRCRETTLQRRLSMIEKLYDDLISAGGSLPPHITVDSIIGRIDQVMLDNDHINEAFGVLSGFEVNESPQGAAGDLERAKALNSLVTCRETTLQRISALLERMYDDLMGHRRDNA